MGLGMMQYNNGSTLTYSTGFILAVTSGGQLEGVQRVALDMPRTWSERKVRWTKVASSSNFRYSD